MAYKKQTAQDRLNESEGKRKGMIKKKQGAKARLDEAEGKARGSISPAMERKLKEHSKTHSPAHMKKMRILLKEKKSFKQAHAMADKMVGK